MFRLLLTLLLMLAPHVADARGRNVPRTPNNFLIVVTDDISANQVAGFDVSGVGAITTPEIDALVGTAHRFSRTWTEPLCGPTRVQLSAMSYLPSTWGVLSLGNATGPGSAPWAPRHLEGTDIAFRLFGKPHFWNDSGYCSDDGTQACFWDDQCTAGTCEYENGGGSELTSQGIADLGWNYTGWGPTANPPNQVDWTYHVADASADRSAHSISTTLNVTDFADDYIAARFGEWWAANPGRKLAVLNTGAAHLPDIVPPGEATPPNCPATEGACYRAQLEHVYQDTIPLALTNVDLDDTCVVILPDNGGLAGRDPTQGTFRGAKTQVWDGGIRVGSIWSPSCFARGAVPPEIDITPPNIMRFALQTLGVFDPALWDAAAGDTFDNRTNADRTSDTSDLLGWARGACGTSACWPREDTLAAYAYSAIDNQIAVTEDGYKLVLSPEVADWIAFYAIADEATPLCEEQTMAACRAALSGPALVAFDDIAADRTRIENNARAATLSVLSFAHSSGTLNLTAGPNSFIVSNAGGTDFDANWSNPHTTIRCSIDWGDGGPVELVAGQPTQVGLQNAYTSQVTVSHSYPTPGAYNVTGTCFDILAEPETSISINSTYTLAGVGGGGISGTYAQDFDGWTDTCAENASPELKDHCDDSGVVFGIQNPHGLATGASCLRGGAGDKCIIFNPGCAECTHPDVGYADQNGLKVLANPDFAGNPGKGFPPGLDGGWTVQLWHRFESDFVWTTNEIKAIRCKTAGGLDGCFAAWEGDNCASNADVSTFYPAGTGGVNCMGVELVDAPSPQRNEWLLLQGVSDGAGTFTTTLYDSAATLLGTSTDNEFPFPPVDLEIPSQNTPSAQTNFPEENLLYVDEYCYCQSTTCGVGGSPDANGWSCNPDFPGS